MSDPREKRGPEMDFFGHLEILRRGIVAVLLFFLVAVFLLFTFMDEIMPSVVAPAASLGVKLYALSPFEKFFSYLKVSALLGLAAALPFAALLAAVFTAPALEPRSRRFLGPVVAAVLLFVLAGAALAWFVLLPFAIRFFAGFSPADGIEPLWGLGSYVSLAAGLLLASSLVFLVPPVLLAAFRIGLVSPAALAKRRRYAIVAIAVAAGVLTPTVDVVTQALVGAVMWLLYELTLLAGRFLAKDRGRDG